MLDFSDTDPTNLAAARPSTLTRNAYFNAATPFPFDPTDALNISNDSSRIEANPLLASQSAITTPHWLPAQGQFNGGALSIRQAFVALATTYGKPSATSAISDAAIAGLDVPSTDILGTPRPPQSADLGCFELSDVLFANGFETF